MKNSWRLASICLITSLLLFSGCGKGSDPLPEVDRVRSILTTGTWQVNQVSIDQVDKTSQFTGLSLTFSAGGYTTTNGKVVWPATGTWKFKDDTATALLRDGSLEVGISEVSDTSLKLSFTWAQGTLGAGRSGSVAGKHDFTFRKN